MTDVVIVGGGVAGSALALLLGRQGLEVELLEKGAFPREKACGEGVMPAGAAALARMGVEVEGAPFQGVRYHAGPIVAAGRFTKAHGIGLRRRVLDEALFRAAARHARAVCGVKVDGPLVANGRVVGVLASGAEHRARLVVAADGVHSTLRRKLGLNGAVPRRRAGARAHFRLAKGAPPSRWVDIFLGGDAEAYVTPLPRGELLVALLGDETVLRRDSFLRTVRSHPALAERMEGAEQISEMAGMSPLVVRPVKRIVPGLALIGDAAGSTDPITGGGISQALLSAELLASHIARSFPMEAADLDRFARARERMVAEFRQLTAMALLMAGRPALARLVVRALRAFPAAFSRLLGFSGGLGWTEA